MKSTRTWITHTCRCARRSTW